MTLIKNPYLQNPSQPDEEVEDFEETCMTRDCVTRSSGRRHNHYSLVDKSNSEKQCTQKTLPVKLQFLELNKGTSKLLKYFSMFKNVMENGFCEALSPQTPNWFSFSLLCLEHLIRICLRDSDTIREAQEYYQINH